MATNSQVDTAAAAVSAPYGPLVRVTDVDSLPTPNEEHTIEFTMANSLGSVFMSYRQLTNSDTRLRILEQAANITGRVQKIKTWVAAVYAVTNALSAPHTYEDLVDVIAALRDNDNPLRGYY
jgi:hypothetical protein